MDFTGVALGSGVNQYMKMDEMARQNKELEMRKALADQQMEKGRFEMDQMRQVNELGNKYRSINAAAARGDINDPALAGFVKDYNNNVAPWNNNLTMSLGTNAKGGRVINFMNGDQVAHSEDWNPKNIQRLVGDAYRQELSYAAPDYFYKNYQLGQKDTELGIMGQYRKDQGRLIDAQIGHYGAQMANANRPQFGSDIQMVDQAGNAVIVTPVRGRDGSVSYVQSQLPAGLKLSKTANTTMTDFDKQNLQDYNKALGAVQYPTMTGNADKDGKARANYDSTVAGLRQQYQVGHLFNNGQTNGPGFNVGALGATPQPAQATATPAAPAQGTGLKKPDAKAKAEAFADKYKGWTRQKAGNDYIVIDPNGGRMWASDFDKQNGANASMMLNYK